MFFAVILSVNEGSLLLCNFPLAMFLYINYIKGILHFVQNDKEDFSIFYILYSVFCILNSFLLHFHSF